MNISKKFRKTKKLRGGMLSNDDIIARLKLDDSQKESGLSGMTQIEIETHKRRLQRSDLGKKKLREYLEEKELRREQRRIQALAAPAPHQHQPFSGVFGPPASSPFGAPAPAPSPFGAPAPAPSPFGAPAPASSPFGAPAPAAVAAAVAAAIAATPSLSHQPIFGRVSATTPQPHVRIRRSQEPGLQHNAINISRREAENERQHARASGITPRQQAIQFAQQQEQLKKAHESAPWRYPRWREAERSAAHHRAFHGDPRNVGLPHQRHNQSNAQGNWDKIRTAASVNPMLKQSNMRAAETAYAPGGRGALQTAHHFGTRGDASNYIFTDKPQADPLAKRGGGRNSFRNRRSSGRRKKSRKHRKSRKN